MRILITGGSRGIGAACVRAFALEGNRVAFLYHTQKERAEALAAKTGAIALQADISDAEQAQHAVEKVVEALGGIDVLVNNAGIAQIKLFTNIGNEEWRRMIDTNLGGAFYVTRAAVKYMIAQQMGRIVNIGSMWGKTGASCEVAYSASKAGIRGLTMALAKELGPSHITVNCIEPGLIDTEMNKALDADTREALIEETPVCRIGTPEDVLHAVRFFLCEEASFITGQCLGVDGGFAV